MSEALSTANVPVSWTSKEERRREAPEAPETGFFLFREDEGRVVVRGPAANGTPKVTGPMTSVPAESDLNSMAAAIKARVPQTKLLSSGPDQRYILLKKYEGFVTARRESNFSARLFESNSDYPVIEAEFDFEELSETDRELAVEGAAMVWTIGYAYDGSTRKRESFIYLRRLPAWSEKELQQGREAAEDLSRAIRWE
jgi:hypothetical protein